ncbi:MAG TPA: hypothetical protein VNM72_04785 [Blastocatellia bacterium]|nr:hypothetical protein [Blastocatellia bacterium]
MKNNRRQTTPRWLGLSISLMTLLSLSGGRWTTPPDVAAPTVRAAQVPLPPVPWTAVASTGVVDEESLSRYEATGSSITYRSTSPSLDPIVVRYNVTNPSLNQAIPGWTQLELGSAVPAAGGVVSATLFRVDPCTGEQQEICTTTNEGINPMGTCKICQFPANAINFSSAVGFLYYVRVVLDRADQPNPPSVHTLRLR